MLFKYSWFFAHISCKNIRLILVILSQKIDSDMLFEFDVRVFSLKLVPFFFLGGGGISYAKLQTLNLNFTRFLFLTLFNLLLKNYIKKSY